MVGWTYRRLDNPGEFSGFEGMNHMQYQIRDPAGGAEMLETIMETGRLPELPFLRQEERA